MNQTCENRRWRHYRDPTLTAGEIVDRAALSANFGKLHARHVAALTRHLVACRAAFDGDLDLFLVLTIIGERSFTARNAPDGMTEAQFRESPVNLVEPAAINLQSIADFSGIARETVRRKIGVLVDRGWVQRSASGLLTVTDQAKDSLQSLTDSSARYLRDLLSALESSGREV